jgi:hypothetical protein
MSLGGAEYKKQQSTSTLSLHTITRMLFAKKTDTCPTRNRAELKEKALPKKTMKNMKNMSKYHACKNGRKRTLQTLLGPLA